jgi:hypothetical protein
MKKVFARFGGLNFTVICEWRRSASQQLTRYVISGFGIRQRVGQLDSSGGKF